MKKKNDNDEEESKFFEEKKFHSNPIKLIAVIIKCLIIIKFIV